MWTLTDFHFRAFPDQKEASSSQKISKNMFIFHKRFLFCIICLYLCLLMADWVKRYRVQSVCMGVSISFILLSSWVLKKEAWVLRKWAVRVSQHRRRELRLRTRAVKSRSLSKMPSARTLCESLTAPFHIHINNAVIIWFGQLTIDLNLNIKSRVT